MPTLYKYNPQWDQVESVELPDKDVQMALNSGWSRTNPKPPVYNTPKAAPDVINTDYFNNLLDLTEQDFSNKRGAVEQNYNTLVSQLKQSDQLFNSNLETDYGKALENLNIDSYNRGIETSGVKGRELTDLGGTKEAKAQEQKLLSDQKKLIASEDRQQKLSDLAIQESKTKLDITHRAASPYAAYSYS